jgi:hypothetical protein
MRVELAAVLLVPNLQQRGGRGEASSEALGPSMGCKSREVEFLLEKLHKPPKTVDQKNTHNIENRAGTCRIYAKGGGAAAGKRAWDSKDSKTGRRQVAAKWAPASESGRAQP